MENTEILVAIRKIVRSINLESKRIQKEYGISIPQLLCLQFLEKSDGFESTQRKVREYLQLNSSTVTGIISRLEKKGFIARLPKKEDKRVTYLVLTSIGKKTLDAAPNLLQDKLLKKLNALPENEVGNLNNSLDVLIQALGIDEIDASPILSVESSLSATNA